MPSANSLIHLSMSDEIVERQVDAAVYDKP